MDLRLDINRYLLRDISGYLPAAILVDIKYNVVLSPEGAEYTSVGHRPTEQKTTKLSPERAEYKILISPFQGLAQLGSPVVGRCPTLVYFALSGLNIAAGKYLLISRSKYPLISAKPNIH